MCVCVLRYLKSVEAVKKLKPAPSEPMRKVISMSLWSAKPRYTYGALRNAQLLPIYFPGWTLRFYVERPHSDDTTKYSPVPPRILNKLSMMGSEIVYVDAERSHIPPMMWRFLIADDMSVDVFIVRDSDCRLNDRDFTAVSNWLRTDYAFHCIRDHPSHAGYSLLGGLWGARPRQLRSFVSVPWRDMMMGYRTDYVQDMQFLSNAIWPLVQSNAAYCHDSVSCLVWVGAHAFPVPRVGTEHLGQVFDAFGNARDEDIQILLEHRPLPQCTVSSTPSPRNTVQASVPRNSITKISETVKEDDSNAAIGAEPNDKGIQGLGSGGSTVSVHTNTTTASESDVHGKISSHSVAVEAEVSDLNKSLSPHVSSDDTQPKSHNFQFNSYHNRVPNVYYNRSVQLNTTFIINDGS